MGPSIFTEAELHELHLPTLPNQRKCLFLKNPNSIMTKSCEFLCWTMTPSTSPLNLSPKGD